MHHYLCLQLVKISALCFQSTTTILRNKCCSTPIQSSFSSQQQQLFHLQCFGDHAIAFTFSFEKGDNILNNKMEQKSQCCVFVVCVPSLKLPSTCCVLYVLLSAKCYRILTPFEGATISHRHTALFGYCPRSYPGDLMVPVGAVNATGSPSPHTPTEESVFITINQTIPRIQLVARAFFVNFSALANLKC